MPVIVWMGIILTVSSIPGKSIPDIEILNIDKAAHFLEFLVFGFLLVRAFKCSYDNMNLAKAIILSLSIAFLYAVLDELHQQFIPDRMMDFFDLISDWAGSCVGIFLYRKG